MNIWNREPARLVALLQAAIALGIAFGLKLSPVQVGAITAFFALALGELTRSQVAPVPKEPPKPPSAGKAVGLAGAIGLLALLTGCSAASSQMPAPCDDATAAKMAALCGARVQLECVQKGIAEELCPVIKECDEAAQKRETECLK